MTPLKARGRAAAIHLALSALVALGIGALVLALWYPYPYRELSGGRELFLIVIAVDVVMGPLITFAVFNTAKPRRELRLDLAVVAGLQVAALAYGLWTVQLARPVQLVFEIDRFRVIHKAELPMDMLDRAPRSIDPMPLTGPGLLGLRAFRDANEKADATMAALGGVHLGARPDLWQPYAQSVNDVLKAAQPVAQLRQRFPQQSVHIDAVLRTAGRTPEAVAYVPLVGRKSFWTAFVDAKTADVIAFLPLDPF